MKKITMVLIGCFISFFLGLLNSGYSEDVKSDFDFSVVFPKDDVVYLNGNPSLALMWRDEKTDGSEAEFDAGAVYEVSIWENNSSEERIFKTWLWDTKMCVMNTLIAEEIGIESGKSYFWEVKRYSQSEGRMISTDMGSFSVAQGNNIMDFSGHLCGHVSTGHDFVEVTRNGHTEELDVRDEFYFGTFSPGSYSVCAGDQCYESVKIKAFDITESSF